MKTITPTSEDIISAFKLNAFENPHYRKFRAIVPWRWVLVALGIGFFFIGFYINQKSSFYFDLVIGLMGYASLILGLLPILMPHLMRITGKITWKKNRILHKPYTLTWNDNYLFISSNQTKSQVEWCTYCEIVQNEHYFLAYYQRGMFLIIPKRFFENAEEVQDFSGHLQKGVVQNKATTN